MKKKVATRQLINGLVAGIGLVVLVSLVYAAGVVYQNKLAEDEGRVKRSLLSDNEYLFKNSVHKVHWTRSQAKHKDSSSSTIVPNSHGKKSPLEEIFISVKTATKFHLERLQVILDTWFNLAPDQIWFFSDSDDPSVVSKTNGHLVNTKCSSSHNRSALCCKMAAEILAFLATDNKWFCHFDDDNYVNVPALVDRLQHFDHNSQWYLGKPSIPNPLEVINHSPLSNKKKISFWFATGGAGFCLSRPLAERMAPLVENGEFVATGENIRLPDDVTVGYIVEHLLGIPLTVVRTFHSHLEPLRLIPESSLAEQISFGYSHYADNGDNHINVSGLSEIDDPTRFISLHCYLFPNSLPICPQ